jgi:general stress protein YciG
LTFLKTILKIRLNNMKILPNLMCFLEGKIYKNYKETIMTGTTEGGKKAAQTRGHESLSEAGRKGGQQADHEQAAKTRGHERLSEAGRKGGQNSHKGGKE